MAYIGEKILDKVAYVVRGGLNLITTKNTENNTIYIDTSYKDTMLKNMNIDTTTTLVSTNNYFVLGNVEVADTKTWDIAGTGVLKII